MVSDAKAVVVTGLGVVDPHAWGIAEVAAAYANPNPQPVEVDRSAGYHRDGGSRCALFVDSARQGEWLHPLAARRMSAASRFAVCAAKMAVEDAQLEEGGLEGRTAVVIATAYGAADISERILRQIFLEGPEAVSPALFTESVANAPAAQVGLTIGARASNITVTQRQAGSPIALARALAELRSGRAERVLVGAVDEMTPLLHAILDRIGALARPNDTGVEQGRPFDKHRMGWMASEGAVVAVLELETAALDRGAPSKARIIDAGSAFDPQSPRSGWSRNPTALARSLSRFLKKVDCAPGEINRIVSGACGHFGADRLEGKILNSVWNNLPMPPVLAPAGTSGAYGGSLLAGSLLAASGLPFGATPGFADVDPAIEITPHDGGDLPSPQRVLMMACAAGGAAGWALLEPVCG